MDFVFTLHSHLPYVLNHGRWPHGSDWICEAAIDTYLPLIEAGAMIGVELLYFAAFFVVAWRLGAGAEGDKRKILLTFAVLMFAAFVARSLLASFVLVDVRRGGASEEWHLELDNRWELADIGFTETTLKPGDRVVVTGSPARREPQRMYVRRLDRPTDGFSYEQVGTRPRLRKSAR